MGIKIFDKSKNFRNYQLSLIKDHLKGHVAEVGPGNGINLSNYYKFPKKIDLYEPTKKLHLQLKKNLKKIRKSNFIIKYLEVQKNITQFYIWMLLSILKKIKKK